MVPNPVIDGNAQAVDIFETQELNLIWKNNKTLDDEVEYSFWRPTTKSGFYTITHHITKGHMKPGVGFTMKTKDQNLVAMPESYMLSKKTSKGLNLADEQVFAHIYSVNCPAGWCSVRDLVSANTNNCKIIQLIYEAIK